VTPTRSISACPPIDKPSRDALAVASERRVGHIVATAAAFELERIHSPAGTLTPGTHQRLVLALTDTDVWLLELRQRLLAVSAGAVLGRLPRNGVVAHFRHRRWNWPLVWRAELSWPEAAILVEGAMLSGDATDQLIGLLTADEFARELDRGAPAP
jgi:hypothetical protein